ncbi:TapB family protein [Formosa haliotis]|uniref:TapB family protein n=1 Tax=Formosa haliotis TaxID=1555194 RepID=UPI001146AAEE|nr:hypothetical protein [Formosa haliotis]
MIALAVFFVLTSVGYAQSCDGYYPTTKGVEYEHTRYDKKDRVEAKKYNIIKDIQKEGGKTVVVVHTVTEDSKGKETINTDYNMYCENGNIKVDLKTLLKERISASLTNTNSDAETEVNGTNIVMPNNLKVGDELPNSDIHMDIMAGTTKMGFGAKTFNRKVVGEETITVPAGTFDCMVLTENTEIKMLITKKGTSKLWMAKGVGLVKLEEYNKKGDLVGREVLTVYKK